MKSYRAEYLALISALTTLVAFWEMDEMSPEGCMKVIRKSLHENHGVEPKGIEQAVKQLLA